MEEEQKPPVAGIVALLVLIAIAAISIIGFNWISNWVKENANKPPVNQPSQNNTDPNNTNNQNDNIVGQNSGEGTTEVPKEEQKVDDKEKTPTENNPGSEQTENNNSAEKPDEGSSSTDTSSLTSEALKRSLENQQKIRSSGIWTATNYVFGDIKGDKHTVQLGDTLWEIADGFFGNPYNWTTLRDLNKEIIKFLPNGQQALILPDQVLKLK